MPDSPSLRTLAEAALKQGHAPDCLWRTPLPTGHPHYWNCTCGYREDAIDDFTEAASPSVVLALLARAEEAEARQTKADALLKAIELLNTRIREMDVNEQLWRDYMLATASDRSQRDPDFNLADALIDLAAHTAERHP